MFFTANILTIYQEPGWTWYKAIPLYLDFFCFINPVIFRTNPVIFRKNPVIFRINPVIIRTNPVSQSVSQSRDTPETFQRQTRDSPETA